MDLKKLSKITDNQFDITNDLDVFDYLIQRYMQEGKTYAQARNLARPNVDLVKVMYKEDNSRTLDYIWECIH